MLLSIKNNQNFPTHIRVWRRSLFHGKNSCAQDVVDLVKFETYVQRVLPNEWVPSWPMESLKAGAIAIRTYALYWVLRGGKYKCADLCDTTMSQRYKVKHTKRTDKAVNETKGQVIINKNNNEIIQSEYCAENGYITKYNVVDAVCKGYVRDGHGRGMCQWGSMRWASETGGNKKYKWIIEHYYPECAVINKR